MQQDSSLGGGTAEACDFYCIPQQIVCASVWCPGIPYFMGVIQLFFSL